MTYKIEVYTKHEAHISDAQEKEITIKVLRNILYPGEYIRYDIHCKDTVWLKRSIPNYHGSDSEETVRRATELDIAVLKVLDALKK